MNERPELETALDEETFRSYYYLKEELTAFCRQQGLQASGGKEALTDRIAVYLATGEKTAVENKREKAAVVGEITTDTLIEAPFVCSEKHRAFFKSAIGNGFSFNVAFQKWLKSNAGKTYQEAVEAYHRILNEKKSATTAIDKQFEYNTYIRAFFADNPGKALQEAISCWKYKKSLRGHNQYERADLQALHQPPETGAGVH